MMLPSTKSDGVLVCPGEKVAEEYADQDDHRAVPDQEYRGDPSHHAGTTSETYGGRRLQPFSGGFRSDSDRLADGFGNRGDVHRTMGGDDARRRIVRGIAELRAISRFRARH